MRNEPNHSPFPKSPKKPKLDRRCVVGTGLVSLDIVAHRDHSAPPRLYAGGTCGNVLAIMAFLGWKSIPVARMDHGPVALHILRDLRRFHVVTDFMHLGPQSPAPVIVEWISQDGDGNGMHRYSFTCSDCGNWYPGFRAVVAKAAGEALHNLGNPAVFFFDRVSRSALDLAESFRHTGGLVVFEPSGVGDPKQFRKAVDLCHVLKYSSDRMSDLATLPRRPIPPLEISTLGSSGLVYRSKLSGSKSRSWRRMDSIHLPRVVDAAGSGDWFTATMLDGVARNGFSTLDDLSVSELDSALHRAQAAAAWNCAFEGPRGGMYSTTGRGLNAAITSLLQGRGFAQRVSPEQSRSNDTLPPDVCLCCSPLAEPAETELARQ